MKSLNGSLLARDGKIVDLGSGVVSVNGALDLEGDYLLPGLVELHTDHLEKHLTPRPGVVWPNPLAALKAHDAQIISAGVTTVLDAVFRWARSTTPAPAAPCWSFRWRP